MFGTEILLVDCERAPVRRFGLAEVGILEQRGEVVEADSHVGMLGTDALRVDCERAPHQRLSLAEPVGILEPIFQLRGIAGPHCGAAGVSTKKECSSGTTAAPSPIAPPTRLTEPQRTSPTANTPNMLDSSSIGSRAFIASSSGASEGPVRTKPFLSSKTPQSFSQCVAGSAPMKTN